MIQYLRKFFYVLSTRKEKFFILIAMFTLTSILEVLGIGLIAPFVSLASRPDTLREISILNWLYEVLGLNSNTELLGLIALTIIVIFLVKTGLYIFAQNYVFRYSFNQESLLVSRLIKGYLGAPYTFHLKQNSSHLINNITVESSKFIHYGLLSVLNVISNSFIVLILLLLLAKSNMILLASISATLLPIFLIFQRMGGTFKRLGVIQSTSRENMIRTVNHGLGGLKETRIIGCEKYFLDQVNQQTSEYERSMGSLFTAQVLPRAILEVVIIIFLIVYLTVSQIFFGLRFDELAPVIGVFTFTALRLIPAFNHLIQGFISLRNSGHILDVLYLNLKEIESSRIKKSPIRNKNLIDKVENRKSINPALEFENLVELNNITYRYPNTDNPAICGISLKIRKGESVALIGKSGSGKTTLVDVILGLLQPESGDIWVDNQSVYHDLDRWQNLIGYIPQTIFLMDDTIERNIAFGVPDDLIDYKKLNEAIQMAQLEDLVDHQLPEGLKTFVGERGVRLSGGQRQRIGIARALYHEREILVLDEATSALDNETEKLVSQSVQNLSGKKTIIIIAHRLTTIKHCDRVYMLENGSVAKTGTYQEVVPT